MTERPKIELPGIKCNLGTEYNLAKQGWLFDLGNIDPRFITASRSLTELLKDSTIWTLEAIRNGARYKDSEESQIYFVLYSPDREQARYTKKDLVLDLKELLRPEIWNLRGLYTQDLSSNCTSVNLPPLPIYPLSSKSPQDNPLYPCYIDWVRVNNFQLYLNYRIERPGGIYFDDPAPDPRRVVAEIHLANPVARMKTLASKRVKNWDLDIKTLLEARDRLSESIFEDILVILNEHKRIDNDLINRLLTEF